MKKKKRRGEAGTGQRPAYLSLDVGKDDTRHKEEEQSRCVGQERLKRRRNVIAGWNQLGPRLSSNKDHAVRLEVNGVVPMVGPGGERRRERQVNH